MTTLTLARMSIKDWVGWCVTLIAFAWCLSGLGIAQSTDSGAVTAPAAPAPTAPATKAGAAPYSPQVNDASSDSGSTVRGLLFGNPEREVEFHGFLNIEGFGFQRDAEHNVSSFDIHNFYFAAKATINSKIQVFAELEYEHGATIRLDRAFIDWNLHPWITLRVGRFYVPFSYERPRYWAPVRLMTSRPLVADISFHEWADTGIELHGRNKWVGYEFALVNGPQGLTERGIPSLEVRDNNSNKVPIFRLNLYPVKGLETGVAFAKGKYDREGKLDFRMFELDARFRRGRLDVWSEYQKRSGSDEPCSNEKLGCDPSFSGERARKEGYYALAAYRVLGERKGINYLKPVFRFDRVKTMDTQSEVRRVSTGLNWSPVPHFVFKSEYQWNFEVKGPQLKNNGLMFSAVADF